MSGFKPLSFLYEKAAGFKNYLYDEEYLHSLELPISVLSLGNLTMGGTGKTPVTDLCLRYFQKMKLKVAVVSRNYRAQVQKISKVDIQHTEAAAYYGDEPVLLAQRNPGVDFFVGPQKFRTAQFAVEKCNPQLIIVDDGFQHRQLHRDVDLVILDATESFANYACVPEGRAREPWQALSRATAFIVTKINLAEPEALQELYLKLALFKKPIIPMSYELLRLHNLQGAVDKDLYELSQQKVFLVSAIAQPKTFELGLKKFSVQIKEHLIFGDHHPYTPKDVEEIVLKWRKSGLSEVITTEKDYVKLKPLWPAGVPLWYAPLELQIQSQEDVFYEILAQVLH